MPSSDSGAESTGREASDIELFEIEAAPESKGSEAPGVGVLNLALHPVASIVARGAAVGDADERAMVEAAIASLADEAKRDEAIKTLSRLVHEEDDYPIMLVKNQEAMKALYGCAINRRSEVYRQARIILEVMNFRGVDEDETLGLLPRVQMLVIGLASDDEGIHHQAMHRLKTILLNARVNWDYDTLLIYIIEGGGVRNLVKNVSSHDAGVQVDAYFMLSCLLATLKVIAKYDNSIDCPGIIRSLLECILAKNSYAVDMAVNVFGMFLNTALDKSYFYALIDEGALPVLMECLRLKNAKVQELCMRVLGRLTVGDGATERNEAIVAAGAVPVIIGYLGSMNVRAQVDAAMVLRNLTDVAEASDPVDGSVVGFCPADYVADEYAVNAHCTALVQAGVLPALFPCLGSSDAELRHHVLATLENLLTQTDWAICGDTYKDQVVAGLGELTFGEPADEDAYRGAVLQAKVLPLLAKWHEPESTSDRQKGIDKILRRLTDGTSDAAEACKAVIQEEGCCFDLECDATVKDGVDGIPSAPALSMLEPICREVNKSAEADLDVRYRRAPRLPFLETNVASRAGAGKGSAAMNLEKSSAT